MTDEIHIAKLFAAAFTELDALRQHSPAAAAALSETIAAHLRSSAPMALPAPPPLMPAEEFISITSVARELADGSRYRISRAEAYTMLELSRCDAALTAIEAIRFREDIASVAGSVR